MTDPGPPRFNLVIRPITPQQAIEQRLEQVKRLTDELETLLSSPLPTHETVFEKVKNGDFEGDVAHNPAYVTNLAAEAETLKLIGTVEKP